MIHMFQLAKDFKITMINMMKTKERNKMTIEKQFSIQNLEMN